MSCHNSLKDEIHIVKPGIGYNNFIIDSTKVSDIVDYYGNRYQVDTVHWQYPFDSTQIFCINYEYDTLGVSFSFNPDTKSLISISIKHPFLAKTDKGVVLGQSTFEDVVNAYGETEWTYVGNIMDAPVALTKHYEGIYFRQDFSESITLLELGKVIDTIQEKYLKNKVTEIELVKSIN